MLGAYVFLFLQSSPLEIAQQAVAHAEAKEFSLAVASLVELQNEGIALEAHLEGIGSPMVEVVNAIYGHCWANFDPSFNRQCWLELFDTFPESPYAVVAASRLLMAGLKDGAIEEIERIENYFNDLESSVDSNSRYVDAYLQANRSNDKVLQLAINAWNSAWQDAYEKYPDNYIDCELDTDNQFNNLAKATWLHPQGLQVGNPLLEMEAESSVSFSDHTQELGLGDLRETRVASADFDNDGDPDLCFNGRIFENQNSFFEEVGKGLNVTKPGAASAFADFDKDGDFDLLIAARPNLVLYENLGKKEKYKFADVSEAVGLNTLTVKAEPEGISWVDVNDDGALDIYIAIYETAGVGNHDLLFLNDGRGKFSGQELPGEFCGRGVSACDIDSDGDQEVFVSNYRLNPNQLLSFVDGTFIDSSAELNIKGKREPADGSYYGHTIGSCWGDINGDGRIDLFSANLAHPRFVRQGFSNLSFLGVQNDSGEFENTFATSGIRFQETPSDPAFVDIDNDGDLDLSITCVYEGVPSALYQNDGTGKFTPITFRAGAVAFHGWGQSWLDINGDGFLDVVYASGNGVRAFINSGNDNHWSRIALSTKKNSAINAIVSVSEVDNENPRTWTRQLFNTRGTSSQDEQVLHFGLGAYSGRLQVEVYWPGSDKKQTKRPKSDRVYVVK